MFKNKISSRIFAALAAAFMLSAAFALLSLFNGVGGTSPKTVSAASWPWSSLTAPTVVNGDTVVITNGASGTLQVPANAVVTVQSSVAVTGAQRITLDIGSNAFVEWKAEYSGSVSSGGLVTVIGTGTLEVISGGLISASGGGYAVYVNDTNSKVMVSGGSVLNSGSGYAVYANGEKSSVTVSDGSVFKSGTGSVIGLIGSSASLNVSGGLVYSSFASGTAVYMGGLNTSVTVSGGGVSATAGYAINATSTGDNSAVTVSGGTVSATTGYAVYAAGANAKVTVSGGEVSNSATTSANPVIFMDNANTGVNVTVSGAGKVKALGAGGYAISTSGGVNVEGGEITATAGAGRAISATGANSAVTVSGGKVLAGAGYAVYADGLSAAVTVSGGFVFAYGSGVTGVGNVIYGSLSANAGEAVILAWDSSSGEESYSIGKSKDIYKMPAQVTAYWDFDEELPGIRYKNGSNEGFFPINGITLSESLELITAAELNGVVSPVSGLTPSAAIDNGEGFTSSLVWEGCPSVFDFDVVYTAVITLTAGLGYTFEEDFGNTSEISGFTVNGITPSAFVSNTGTQLIFKVTFPATAAFTYEAEADYTGKDFDTAATEYGNSEMAWRFTIENTGTGTLTGLTAGFSLGAAFEICEALSGASAVPGYTVTISVRPVTGLLPGEYNDDLIITGDNGAYIGLPLSFTVIKANGAAVSAPTELYVTHDMIIINPVAQPFNRQTPEYAISKSNSENGLVWQESVMFNGLDEETTYYVFARAKEDAGYKAGAALSAAIKTGRFEASSGGSTGGGTGTGCGSVSFNGNGFDGGIFGIMMLCGLIFLFAVAGGKAKPADFKS